MKKALVILLLALALSPASAFADARIVFIDVEQADATLIACDGEFMLVDTGLTSHSRRVASALEAHGVTSIKYLVATHPHADNIGGVPFVLENYDVETILILPLSHTTKAYARMAQAVEASNAASVNPLAGDVFKLGGGNVTVYAPYDKEYSQLNNASMVLRFEYANRSALLCADGETALEKEMLEAENELPLKSDLLRLALHGSRASSSVGFLSAVSPQTAVAACCKEGYPHSEVLARLEEAGVENILITGEMGDICVDITENGDMSYYSFAGGK